MTKNKETITDNIFDDEMGDLVIEGTNITRLTKENKNKEQLQITKIKRQRNEEIALRNFYQSAFEILIIIIFATILCAGLYFLINQIGKGDENLQSCIASGISESRCLKSEGVY